MSVKRPVIHISEILTWADAFRRRFHRWPCRDDGPVEGQINLTWCGIDQALKKGHRGILPGSSLAKLLRDERGVRHKRLPPHYTEEQILRWADAHHKRNNEWPIVRSGPI